jgi:hypothetical protein
MFLTGVSYEDFKADVNAGCRCEGGKQCGPCAAAKEIIFKSLKQFSIMRESLFLTDYKDINGNAGSDCGHANCTYGPNTTGQVNWQPCCNETIVANRQAKEAAALQLENEIASNTNVTVVDDSIATVVVFSIRNVKAFQVKDMSAVLDGPVHLDKLDWGDDAAAATGTRRRLLQDGAVEDGVEGKPVSKRSLALGKVNGMTISKVKTGEATQFNPGSGTEKLTLQMWVKRDALNSSEVILSAPASGKALNLRREPVKLSVPKCGENDTTDSQVFGSACFSLLTDGAMINRTAYSYYTLNGSLYTYDPRMNTYENATRRVTVFEPQYWNSTSNSTHPAQLNQQQAYLKTIDQFGRYVGEDAEVNVTHISREDVSTLNPYNWSMLPGSQLTQEFVLGFKPNNSLAFGFSTDGVIADSLPSFGDTSEDLNRW